MNPKVLKKLFLLPMVCFTAFFPISCSDNSIKKDGLIYGEVVGELYHTQYWDSNDHWDLKNMYLILHYEDETIERVDADDPHAHYTFSPETPTGLPLGETSFELVSGYYVDYKGEHHEIKPRTFEGATIIKNPNSAVTDDTPLIVFRITVLAIVVILTPITIGTSLFSLYKKKKSE